ncbi:MAG: serine/threonine-protein kinase PknK, partial [bacterium]|nr:serine/threonine-protein kinase PknK [bacterium]
LKIEHSTPSDIARFKQEYEIIKGLHFEGILETFDIIEYTEGMALVLEDFDGCSLKEIIGKEKTIDIRLFLEIAISVSEIVGTLHKNNIIHRDIKPHNILINGETKKIRLIDFGISSELTHEHEEIYSREVIEGTLAYMSPEQTGRMNRVVDYRTDIYSMGITFYEMLAGEVPFLSEDPLEIIHSHIAKRPVPLFSRESAIPEMISRIIMKQLSKTAEERYQNSFGLMADFRKCLDELDREGKIAPFDPGMKDISLKFSVSRKLVGRERESHRILAAFDRACTGSLLQVFSSEREIVLVTGGPGIGKSALVNSLQKSIAAKNAFFISGRYDRFRRDVPYSAILEAFRGVIRQILSESKEVINHWKESFTKVLGSGGGVITDVIPGMELIIGPQADLPPVSPEESQNRFIHIFKSFIRILATHEHPLVFFLDDLQWADSAGLQLLKSILSDSEIKSLFFIGAYRDNDAEEESTLQETIDAFAHDGGIITLIALSTLSVENINTLVSDSLRCDKKKSYSLAEMVHWKTNGNPSFVNQFMEILYRKGLLELCSEKGWQWDLDKIRRLQVTDNVVNLLAGRITQLEEKTIQALKVCACIGNRFDLEMLSSILNTPIEKVPGILREAILEGLIYMFDDVYFFQHERIREAAYSLLPEREKAEIHLKTGRVLLEKRGGFELREDIFDITDQLNFGASLLTDPEERYELALLNLMAGSQAKATGAFTAAYNYLKSGVALEEKESWKKQYNLTLALYKGLAEAAYLNGCYDEMETIAGNILEEIQTITDRIKIYEVRIRALIAQNRLIDAIETALPVFKLLGFRIPANPGKAHMLIAYLEIGLLLRGKNIDDLSALPDMKDPLKLAIPRLLLMVFPAFYIAKPNIVPVLVFKAISLLIKNGNSSEAPFVYSLYGFILCGALERIDEGYKFGKLALNLLEGKPNDSLRPRTLFVVNDFIRHWKEHPGDFQQSLLEGYRTGMKTGDLEFAGYSLFLEDYMLFMTGTELPVLEQNMRKNNLVLEQLNHAAPLCYARIFHQAVLNFMGFLHESWDLTGEAYNEKEMIQAHHDTKDRTALCNLYLCKLILSYVFRELPQSLENSRRCREYLDGSMGTLNNPVFYFFDSLVRLALCNRSNLRRARKNQVQMKKWASHAPMNHLHRYYLVEAEIARVSGNHTKAMDFYGKAISEAHKNKYIQDEALANECAARYYKGREAAGIAGLYFTRAHACYSRWGAAAKAKQLEARYPEYLFRGMKKVSTGMAVRSSTLSTTESISEALDLSTVVKASQAISGEIVLSRLLSRLMQLTLENAGAEKGCLLLEKEGKIFVEAEGEVGNSGVRVLES